MQNRITIPPQVSAIIVQIDAVKNDSNLSIEFFTDLKSFSYRHLTTTHPYENQKHSFAKWVHLAGRQDILNWLYQNATEADVNNNYFLLHWAVLCRQPEQTIIRLSTYKRTNSSYSVYYRKNDPYLTKQNNMTPLLLAVSEGNLEMVNWLIESTHDAQATTANTTSPLHLSVSMSNEEMVRLLLERKALLDAYDENGRTPLHLAMIVGHPDIISTLVKAGADILAQDSVGTTPVHLAMRKNEDTNTYLELLMPKDLTWTNVANYSHLAAFTLAASNNQINLISHCLDQQYQNDNNAAGNAKILPATFSQALRAASRHGLLDVVELLLPHIPSIKEECADKPGSALSMAACGKHLDVIKALFRHLLTDYIVERDSGPEFKKHTYFFIKKGAGYRKEKKIDAARALLAVVNGTADADTLNDHHGPLFNKSLYGIFKLVDKFMFRGYQPSAVNAVEPTTITK